MIASRRGMALVAMVVIVSLVAILAVATLSVTTRLDQGSSLAIRDARLDAAASYALTTALVQWRSESFSTIGGGSSRSLGVPIVGSSIAASITVTRLNAELFWVVAEATDVDHSRRSESMILRLTLPRADSIPAFVAGGDVLLTRQVAVVRDTQPQCNLSVPDLMIGPHASLTSPDGALPPVTVARSHATTDSSYQLGLDSFDVAAVAASADAVLPAGAVVEAPNGVVHGIGDVTLTGGVGQGILVVDGRLNFAGPVDFAGMIVARGGVVTTGGGAVVTGSIRTGPAIGGLAPTLAILNPFEIHPSACLVQTVLTSALTPHLVLGRPWAEMY
jgi:hypothetical protein